MTFEGFLIIPFIVITNFVNYLLYFLWLLQALNCHSHVWIEILSFSSLLFFKLGTKSMTIFISSSPHLFPIITLIFPMHLSLSTIQPTLMIVQHIHVQLWLLENSLLDRVLTLKVSKHLDRGFNSLDKDFYNSTRAFFPYQYQSTLCHVESHSLHIQ